MISGADELHNAIDNSYEFCSHLGKKVGSRVTMSLDAFPVRGCTRWLDREDVVM